MTASEAAATSKNLETVRKSARDYAFDWYLSALLAPRSCRQDLIAFAALIGEIERTPLVVSDPALGEIRLQWWLDWLDGLDAGTRSGNPVADLAGEAILRRGLSKPILAGLIEARGSELYALAFETRGALEQFLDRTNGAAMALCAQILEGEVHQDGLGSAKQALTAVGRAYGIARQLARLPQLAVRGRWGLYSDASGEIDASQLHDPAERRRADAVRAEAIRTGSAFLAGARQITGGRLTQPTRAGLPVAMVSKYLSALHKQDDWLRSEIDIPPLVRVWTMWRSQWTGRF